MSLDQAIEFVQVSHLGKEAKGDLRRLLSHMNDADIQIFVELATQDPKLLEILSENYRRKKSTSLDNTEAWKKIIDEEEKYLGSL